MDDSEVYASEEHDKQKKIRACDRCHKRKVKCDGESPCSGCIKHNIACLFSKTKKERKVPERSAKRIDRMEERMARLESFLERQQSIADRQRHRKRQRVESSEDDPGDTPSTRIHSELSLPSRRPRTFAPRLDKTTTNAFFDRMQEGILKQPLSAEIAGPQILRHAYTPLPPLREALPLIDEYFDDFNNCLPLFDRSSFMDLVQDHYSKGSSTNLGRWASLNVVLSLCHRFRAMKTLNAQEEDANAWKYLENCISVLDQLTLLTPSLLVVQAVLGMAIILQGTPNANPASVLTAIAIRLSHNIGLHDQRSLLELPHGEAEQRRRVFWILYVIETGLSFRTNRPSLQKEEEIDIDLPSDNPQNDVGYITTLDGRTSMNWFRSLVELAIMQAEMHNRLFTARARKQRPDVRLRIVVEMDGKLQAWRARIPPGFNADDLPHNHSGSMVFHLGILNLTYWHSLTTLFQRSSMDQDWTKRLIDYSNGLTPDEDLFNIGGCSRETCVVNARRSVRLASVLPQGNYACIWLVLCHYASALMILLASCLQYPHDPLAESDLELCQPVLNLLDSLATETNNERLRRLTDTCLQIEHQARINTNTQQTQNFFSINKSLIQQPPTFHDSFVPGNQWPPMEDFGGLDDAFGDAGGLNVVPTDPFLAPDTIWAGSSAANTASMSQPQPSSFGFSDIGFFHNIHDESI